MATKKEKKAEKKVMTAEEKAAKKKARLEAIKNRPAIQRPNSKQIDVIETEKYIVKNYGYGVKSKKDHVGVLVTSVIEDKEGNPIGTSIAWVPGKLTVKAKKNHGIICSPKIKDEDIEEEEKESEED